MITETDFIFFKDSIAVNYGNTGILIKGCRVESLNINQSLDSEPYIGSRKVDYIPSFQVIDVELNIKAAEIHNQSKKYNFKEMLKELSIEELFKVINKKISSN